MNLEKRISNNWWTQIWVWAIVMNARRPHISSLGSKIVQLSGVTAWRRASRWWESSYACGFERIFAITLAIWRSPVSAEALWDILGIRLGCSKSSAKKLCTFHFYTQLGCFDILESSFLLVIGFDIDQHDIIPDNILFCMHPLDVRGERRCRDQEKFRCCRNSKENKVS